MAVHCFVSILGITRLMDASNSMFVVLNVLSHMASVASVADAICAC